MKTPIFYKGPNGEDGRGRIVTPEEIIPINRETFEHEPKNCAVCWSATFLAERPRRPASIQSTLRRWSKRQNRPGK